jgi:hypothetical protein
MPKKTRKAKPKKTKKTARKPVRKPAKKPARRPSKRKSVKKKPARKKARPARRAAATRKTAVVKAPRPPIKPKAPVIPMIPERPVGIITHYYSHLNVAVVRLDQGPIQVGDSIRIKGHTTDLQQRIESMEVEHQPIQSAQIGQEFGLKVTDHVREHDIVYKVIG